MKRIIETLNEMSFILPSTYHLTTDKYFMPNGQGFINTENYLSDNGMVISFFEIHREKEEFFKYYDELISDEKFKGKDFSLYNKYKLRLGDYVFPIYILNLEKEGVNLCQAYIDCGDCLGCFMFKLSYVDPDLKKMVENNDIFKDVIKILRSVR